MSYEENVTEIETLILEQDMNFYLSDRNNYHVDIAVAALAKHGRLATVFDILTAEEISNYSDTVLTRVLAKIHQQWWDYSTITASPRNLLNEPAPELGWKGKYKQAMAVYLVEHGVAMGIPESPYGWQDYDMKTQDTDNPVIAVINVYEDAWTEFVDTDIDSDEKVGITGEVIFADGTNRKIRHVGSFTDIMRSLTS